MILNLISKSGWTNNSGIVISQNMIENEMDNRGSKSLIYINIFVKEQRVNGSCIGNNSLFCRFNLLQRPMLRCTLMGLERDYPVKILSNQINNLKKDFSTTHKPLTKLLDQSSLNPWFITGFADAESSFSILVQANSKYATGWRIKPVFSIGLHKKDLDLLKEIKSYLGAGKIHIHGKDSIQFRVDSFKELQLLINHFDNFPLVTAKLADYILFKKIVAKIGLKEHLSQQGLLNILAIKASLNLGLNNNIKKVFPNWKKLQIKRPDYTFKCIPNPHWMAGFASGDGSFNLKISDSNTSLLGKRVQLRFSIELNIREKTLIQHLPAYFELTNISKNIYINSKVAKFQIVNTSDILKKIVPFFDKYLIKGKKSFDFRSFKQAAVIIKNKYHLKTEGFEKILDLKTRMNK